MELSKKTFSITMLVITIALMGFGGSVWYKSYQTQFWPSVAGTVISSTVKDTSIDEPAFDVYLWYEYQVEGQKYTSNGISYRLPSASFSYREQADAYAAQFKIGTKVPVFYNPSQPQEALIETGVTLEGIALVLVGIFPLLMFLLNLRSK